MDFVLQCNDWEYVYTPEVNDIMARYSLFKTHNVHSFGSLYDELPALWVDCLNLIGNEADKAVECKRKIDGNKKA